MSDLTRRDKEPDELDALKAELKRIREGCEELITRWRSPNWSVSTSCADDLARLINEESRKG